MRSFFFACLFVLCLPGICWAYVDPGSIAIFMQLIFAFCLGALLTLREKITLFIKTLFRIKTKDAESGVSDDSD